MLLLQLFIREVPRAPALQAETPQQTLGFLQLDCLLDCALKHFINAKRPNFPLPLALCHCLHLCKTSDKSHKGQTFTLHRCTCQYTERKQWGLRPSATGEMPHRRNKREAKCRHALKSSYTEFCQCSGVMEKGNVNYEGKITGQFKVTIFSYHVCDFPKLFKS